MPCLNTVPNFLLPLCAQELTLSACKMNAAQVIELLLKSCQWIKDANFPLIVANCEGHCLAPGQNYLSWEGYGIGKALIFMAIHGMVLFVILLFIESDVINNIKVTFSSKIPYFNTYSDNNSSKGEDDDVLDEKHSLDNLLQEDLNSNKNVLILNHLTKRYGRDVLAVNNICLKVSTILFQKSVNICTST